MNLVGQEYGGKNFTAKTLGGADNKIDMDSENPIPFKMIVMKKPTAYAGIVLAINMVAECINIEMVSCLSMQKRQAAVHQMPRGGDPSCGRRTSSSSFYQEWSHLCLCQLDPKSSRILVILYLPDTKTNPTYLLLLLSNEGTFIRKVGDKKPCKHQDRSLAIPRTGRSTATCLSLLFLSKR